MRPFILFILVGIPLISLFWWIWADRRLARLGTGKASRIALGIATFILLGGFTWVILGRRDVTIAPVPAELYALVLLWGLIFLPFLALPSMLGWSVWSLLSKVFGKNYRQPTIKQRSGPGWTRRRWLGTVATGLPLIATYGAGLYSLPMMKRFRVRQMTVTLKELPQALDGMRIAHLTDTHVGKFTKGKILDEIVAATNGLDPDLILFTGDLIDNSIRDLPEAVKMLQRLKARSGVFVIEGNHDLFDDPVGFERGLRDGGINLLRNQTATVRINGSPVQLMGIVWNHDEEDMAEDVDTVAALRDHSAFPILLAHHPHAFDRAREREIPLTLAGHTHGGQLMLTEKVGAGPMMFRYWSGIYNNGGRSVVVGNGTGNWFPLRVNAPAEILHITLRRA